MRRLVAPLLLLLLAVHGGRSDESLSVGAIDSNAADVHAVATTNENHDKKTRSFVAATQGSAHALTLTTFLTDAAHLHYAVLPAGHEALDAAGVKTAAVQWRVEVSEDTNPIAGVVPTPRGIHAVERVQTAGVVAADTVTVSTAQKVVSAVEKLLPNTSYDVYFVAEVIGSNGVFGPVQSVLQSSTHPEPPRIDIVAVRPANASADTVIINATLTTPGRAYFALAPSGNDGAGALLTAKDLAENRSVGVDSDAIQPKFAVHSVPLQVNSSLAFQKAVKHLAPATMYDMYVMTEAPGNGKVRSEVIHLPNAVRTHVLAPEITALSCSPQNASATAIDVSFQLEVNPDDVRRARLETLSYFKYDLHYEVIALSDSGAATKKSTVASTTASLPAGAFRSTDDISALKNTTIRGVFSLGNFLNVEDFHEGLQETHHANITGLQSGVLYKVKLRAESAGSAGLFGLREFTAQAKTHETAPVILVAAAQATNNSVNSLTLSVELARSRGNVHYVLTNSSGPTSSLRSVFQQATSVKHLQQLLRERSPRDFNDDDFATGVFQFSSEERVTASSDNRSLQSNAHTGTIPEKPTEDTSTEAYRQQFEIKGLKDATSYSIALLPETTKSFGLFGRVFNTLLETATNENASEVELLSAKPLPANVSAVQLEVGMNKPQDLLFLCPKQPALQEIDQEAGQVEPSASDSCHEVEGRDRFEFSKNSPNIFSFTVGNLSEDTEYRFSLYSENIRRNGVLSDQSEELRVRTHKSAPHILETSARPIAATTSRVEAQVVVEPHSPCIVHYAARKTLDSADTEERKHVDAATIVEHSSETRKDSHPHFQHHLPSSSSSFVSGGNVFAGSSSPDTTTNFVVSGLSANTSYEILVVTETSRDGNSSGVLGEPVIFNVTTHAVAPKIVLATVDPVAGSTDSVIISANLSHPGVVHYFLSDVDFADPAIISHNESKHTPHELRGQFQVLEEHILMEVINGTNDTRPTEPFEFVHNTTVGGLKSGRTYHVSLTTETFGSDGVFGEFPPPVLVNTHLGPPIFIPQKLSVHAVDGSSSALAMDFQLDRFGDVHYALFFRGLVSDRANDFENNQKPREVDASKDNSENSGNETVAIWPPLTSTFDLTNLNGSMLKTADFDELGVGVWTNDTISVSREDVLRGKMTHKQIDKLPANALFDVCLVSETAASGGILGWPSDGSASACHRVATHADYTNQSVMFDEIAVRPLGGRTDGIRISLNVSKLSKAPQTTSGAKSNTLARFAQAAGRVPYFVLIDGKARPGRDLGSLSSHRGEVTSAFKTATPGRGDGVVAAGMLEKIIAENATALRIEQDVVGLDANHDYLLFFAYETSGSNGVFTKVNPHKLRSNDTRSENDGIPVTTFESAPRITKAKAQPTFGDTSSITVKFDTACDSCTSALIHLLVFPSDCKLPSSVVDTLRLDQLPDSESNTTISAANVNDTAEDRCDIPLIQKRVKIEMSERQHNRNDVEEELGGDHVLSANTSYVVLLATETAGSQGVLSKRFEEPLRVRTHAPAPSFTEVRMEPRTGSTTELVLTFALDRPGEVHYMIGASGNSEFNVTSPHNISSKGVPNEDRHGRGKGSHDYRQDVVRTKRSVTCLDDKRHVELLDYLVPGTSYDLFIVSEAAPADHGVYGTINEVKDVSTYANAPILLAHTAYPTPGTTQALTVGFRLDAPGIVYFSVVAVKPWAVAEHVAKGSDRYGNRLALEDQLVTQKSLDVDKESMELESDSGWREQILEVPQTGLNYTLHLVTETKGSGGIYGIVATHANVRAHSEAPELINVSVNPTDARVDALSVNATLSDRGHVHYIALPSGRGSTPPSDDFSEQSTELSVLASGKVDINETSGSSQETSFTITGLREGTAYELYFRAETFESFGVYGAWSPKAMTARTHGLPPDVLPEAMECKVMPSCEQRGRQTCSRQANVCGKCLEGYTSASDEEDQEANQACVKQQSVNKAKREPRGPKIKINGVKRNPNLHLSESESEEDPEHETQHPQKNPSTNQQPDMDQQLTLDHESEGANMQQLLPEQQPDNQDTGQQVTGYSLLEDSNVLQEPTSVQAEFDIGQQTTSEGTLEQLEVHDEHHVQETVEPAIIHSPIEEAEPTIGALEQKSLPQEATKQAELSQQQSQQEYPPSSSEGVVDFSLDALGQHEVKTERESDPLVEHMGCPLNAQRSASGLCECSPGYEADERGSSCVLLRMVTAAEAAAAATETAFDILNAHHQIPSQSV